MWRYPVGEGAKRVTTGREGSVGPVKFFSLALSRAFLFSSAAMQWTSAPNIGEAPLPQRARGYWKTRFSALHEQVEGLLERERAQLPPWFVVGLGSGVAGWFALGAPAEWLALVAFAAGLSATAFAVNGGSLGLAD